MKKSISSQTTIALCILFLMAICNTACKKDLYNPGIINNGAFDNSLSVANAEQSPTDSVMPSDEIVAWIKPGKTYADYASWRDSIKKVYGGDVNEKDPCGSCDNSLIVLHGKGIRTYIQTGGTVAGSTTSSQSSQPVGEDGPMYVSRNFPVSYSKPGSLGSSSSAIQPVLIYPGTTVKVAVFDTGVDSSELSGFRYQSFGPSCITGAESGWNFIDQNPNYSDDNGIKHGTLVTRFITNQVVKYGGNKVEILPIKTHTKNGVSDLARILCALAYAKERGVNIINASFGFYLPQSCIKDSLDPNARLFKEFVRHYLTKNHILLIAAAGNKDDINERAAFDLEQVPYTSAPRNLDSVAFLPASLAQVKSLQNVIAVTTVHKLDRTVSPRQNYSANVVDIGVKADAVKGDNYVFNNPLLDSTETVDGSSFATAILTGILCANYDKYKSVLVGDNYTKEEIWNKLSTIVGSDDNFKDKIKNGRYVRK
jgi:hypothetical protein